MQLSVAADPGRRGAFCHCVSGRTSNFEKMLKMRKLDFVLSVVLASVVGLLAGRLLAQDDEINWLENYDEAIREARRTGKPIFLEFRCEP